MIDWLAILLGLGVIAILVGIFAFMAWKINVPEPLTLANLTGKKDEVNQALDPEKKKKDKHGNDQSKKKRKDQKKSKRESKEDHQQRHTVQFKEPLIPTSEETDNEREESEQESTTPQVVETSSKVRHRNKKKARPVTPPPSSAPVEGILLNKDEKSPVTTRAQPIPHPKLATITPRDEVELARQHQQPTKTQIKSTQGSTKQPGPPPSPPIPVRRVVPTSNNASQRGQRQQQPLQEQHEQPFTTVGGNRHKAGTPPNQQQNKAANATVPSSSTSTTTASATAVPTPLPQQQPPPAQNQHEQLPPRQAPPRQQKETPIQLNGFNTNSQPVKQPVAAAPPTKLADLVKALPTSQAVVTELMSALDASTLSSDELDIIMHKIANKQSVLNKDWSKLQHGQKVDPQAHIGQVVNESARAFEEDMKTNAMKRIQELTDERANDKRRINDLLKENSERDLSIQVLHSQLTTIQHPQQQMQTFQVEFKRLSEENMQLKQRFAQQQQHFQQQQQQQQQQLSSMNLGNNTGSDPSNAQLRVISDQIRILSVDNGNLEKQVKAKDSLLKEGQKEKDDLLRSNQQLIQKNQDSKKQLQLNEEKLLKELNETRALHSNQLNDYKRRIEQLEVEKEQLRRVEVAPVEATPSLSNEDREKMEELTKENEQYKSKLTEIQNQYQSQGNQLRQEIEQLKKNSEQEKTLDDELATTKSQLEALRVELEEAKSTNDSTNGQEKQKQFLLELLDQDARNELLNDTKDFEQWFSSYQQIFTSSTEAKKRALQDESTTLKLENDQLHKNMTEVANQLKEIEETVQSKEERLLIDLKSKDATLESIRGEYDQLASEVKRLRAELDRLESVHDTAVNENRALKLQLDERNLINANSSSTTADDSYEFLKQRSPSPPEIDPRAEELNKLIRSTKEVLENQDSIVQQLDKHIDEMHRSGAGEVSSVDDSTVTSSLDQAPAQS